MRRKRIETYVETGLVAVQIQNPQNAPENATIELTNEVLSADFSRIVFHKFRNGKDASRETGKEVTTDDGCCVGWIFNPSEPLLVSEGGRIGATFCPSLGPQPSPLNLLRNDSFLTEILFRLEHSASVGDHIHAGSGLVTQLCRSF